MSNKIEIDNFLKKELKELADTLGVSPIPEQSVYDDKEAKKVKVKDKQVK